MNKSDAMEFFDRCAPLWDAEMVRNETIFAEILDCGDASPPPKKGALQNARPKK